MKKLLLSLAVCLVLPLTAFAQEFNFHDGIKWGMSKEKVKSIEKAMNIDEGESYLLYNAGVVYNMTAKLYYRFTSADNLAGIEYILIPGDNMDYLNDGYEKVKSGVALKYGMPANSEMNMGSLFFLTEWNLGDTNIALKMLGYNYNYNIVLKYASTQYGATLVKEEAERQKAYANKVF